MGQQPHNRGGLVPGAEVFTVEVLDELKGQQGLGRGLLAHQHRNLGAARMLRGTPAPLTGHQPVVAGLLGMRAHDHRLNDPVAGDALRQLGQGLWREDPSRLIGIGLDALERHQQWLPSDRSTHECPQASDIGVQGATPERMCSQA